MKIYRCPWASGNELDINYHDTEWGVPVHDDRKHFEFLILEGAQAGLSWRTILKRREGYRQAFANFDPAVVATYDDKKVAELMQDQGIIRNRLKIMSCVSNAKCFLEVQKELVASIGTSGNLWAGKQSKISGRRGRKFLLKPLNQELSALI